MSGMSRYAILLDGEFVKKTLARRASRFPTFEEVRAEIDRIASVSDLSGEQLYRAFYYTADPVGGRTRNPLSGDWTDLSANETFRRNARLISQLEFSPDVAVRRGVLAQFGWEITKRRFREILSGGSPRIEAVDLQPKIQQKGVDMRIGLDMASLALKRLVGSVVVVSADSDLVPAMRLARREGLRVYLDTLGTTHVKPELKAHADRVIG
jgi:uncharacterized LabA/DUF88 family protein